MHSMLTRRRPSTPLSQVKLWDVERQAVVTRMDGHLGWVWNMLPLSGGWVGAGMHEAYPGIKSPGRRSQSQPRHAQHNGCKALGAAAGQCVTAPQTKQARTCHAALRACP